MRHADALCVSDAALIQRRAFGEDASFLRFDPASDVGQEEWDDEATHSGDRITPMNLGERVSWRRADERRVGGAVAQEVDERM